MAEYKSTDHVGNTEFTQASVVIVGAGISGLCMAIEILRRTPCRKFVILEKGSQVGGTWNDNKYPGCACDVWSSLYSLSFEQKSDWSREYPGQEELAEYLIHVAEKYSLYKYIRFNSTVREARWDDDKQRWSVQVTVTGDKDGQFTPFYELATEFLVSAVGQLNYPQLPNIPGLDDFTGKLMHSARWDWSYDWAGKRVAVIGNGASAVQIVPELAKSSTHLAVYQRTPNWIIPRLNMQVGAIQQALLKYVPPLRWCKRALMMKIREVSHRAIVTPDSAYSQKMIQWAAAAMKKQLSDRPDLWGVLTPDYAPGCKRVLISDDYYQALGRANVVLETRRIRRVTEAGIETDDGEIQEVDLIVCATGFKSVEFLHPIEVYGKGGRPLQEIWKNGGEAYYGIGVEDLPNFGMLYGPNTNLGHNSIILMIEAQARYISVLVDALVRARGAGQELVVTPRREVVREYNRQTQGELGGTSFADPSCQSWYKNKAGRITNNWPGTAVQYQQALSRVRWADYEVAGSGRDLVKGVTNVGRVQEEWPVRPAVLLGSLGALGLAVAGYYLQARQYITAMRPPFLPY